LPESGEGEGPVGHVPDMFYIQERG
jgi:hypothetical protein